MPAVISFGEALVDFTALETGVPLAEASGFHKHAGGAPANVAVGLSRLGVSAGFVGKVGRDPFGRFLAQTLKSEGVDLRGLEFTTEARTGLAFIALGEDGERDFSFYRHPGADMFYRPEDMDPTLLQGGVVFHFGSLSLSTEPAVSAAWAWIQEARIADLKISFDPNLRLELFSSPDQAREVILQAARRADWIKLSGAEFHFLTGQEPDPEHPGQIRAAVRNLFQDRPELLVITLGGDGCLALTPEFDLIEPGFQIEAVDTTGAGDAFTAGLLAGLIGSPQTPPDPARLANILREANAAGALTTTGYGVIPALPSRSEVEKLLADELKGCRGRQ